MKNFLDVLIENHQAQISGFYNDDKTDAEREKRNAVIVEYQDLIAIFKSRYTPTSPVGIDVDQLAKDYADLQIGDSDKLENANQLDRHCNYMEDFKSGYAASRQSNLGTKLIKAMQQVNTLELETEQLINDFKIEIERLTGIIEKLVKDDNMFHVHVQDSYKEQKWQQFKKENKL